MCACVSQPARDRREPPVWLGQHVLRTRTEYQGPPTDSDKMLCPPILNFQLCSKDSFCLFREAAAVWMKNVSSFCTSTFNSASNTVVADSERIRLRAMLNSPLKCQVDLWRVQERGQESKPWGGASSDLENNLAKSKAGFLGIRAAWIRQTSFSADR